MKTIVKKVVMVCAAVFLSLLVFTACAGGSPLKKAGSQLIKDNENNASVPMAWYNEATDTLEISVDGTESIDKAFEVLNQNVEEKDIGRLFFESEDDDDLEYVVTKAGELSCTSIAAFGISANRDTDLDADWTPLIEKAHLLYFNELPEADDIGKGVKDLEKIMIGFPDLYGIDKYENIKEIAVYGQNLMYVPQDVKDSWEGKEPSSEEPAVNDEEAALEEENAATEGADGTAENADGTTEGTDGTSDTAVDDSSDADAAAEDADAADAAVDGTEAEDAEALPVFSGGGVSIKLKDSSLERLIIYPGETSYTTDEEGDAYILYLQNYKPDLLINAPGTELGYDDEGNIDASLLTEVSKVELTQISAAKRKEVISSILSSEAEGVYKKAAKFDSKSGDPKINGKSLVVMVDPDQIYDEISWWNEDGYWPTKKKWVNVDSFTAILDSDDLDGKIETAEMSGDYDTLIYAYPIYTEYARYTSGTKAYRLSYYCQVYDLKKKIAYPSQHITTVDAPNQITYSGEPQDKASGRVKRSKVVKFIKNL